MISLSLRKTIAILLTDSVIWGIWFGGLWSYRIAYAARLTESYTHIAVSTAMPLIAASVIYMVSSFYEGFIRERRVILFKVAIVSSRMLYLATSYSILTNLFSGLRLLYITTAGFTIANTIGSVAGIAWADYIADNIPQNFKSKYIALDSILGTLGALIGTSIAGTMLYEVHSIVSYGRLFTTISLVILINTPFLMLIKDFGKPISGYGMEVSSVKGSGKQFYIAVIVVYLAINLPSSVIPPYIIHRFGGDELWITLINGASLIASLIAPMLWSAAIDFMGSLNTTKIAVALAIVVNVVFPYMPTLYLQVVRAFLAGAAGIGIWVTLFSYLVRDVDAHHRISYIARVFTIQNLIPAIAMNLGGVLADMLSFPDTVFMLTTVGFVALVLLRGR